MLTLDQVKLLEDKVESLIEMVKSLCGERDALRDVLQKKDREIEELSVKVNAYETEQAKIEERVVNALNQLDVFQSSVNCAKAILSQANVACDAHQNSQDGSSKEKDVTCTPPIHNGEGAKMQDLPASGDDYSKGDERSSHVQSASTDEEVNEKSEESEEDSDKQMDIF